MENHQRHFVGNDREIDIYIAKYDVIDGEVVGARGGDAVTFVLSLRS